MFVFDITDTSVADSLEFLVTLYQHSAPIRIGLVPIAAEKDEVGLLLARVFYHLVEENSGPDTLIRLMNVCKQLPIPCICHFLYRVYVISYTVYMSFPIPCICHFLYRVYVTSYTVYMSLPVMYASVSFWYN